MIETVVIRLTDADDANDAEVLATLAELDSACRPSGRVLLAERAGQPVAALGLSTGEAIANPFLPTADVVELLRLRAAQLQPARRLFRGFAASGKPVGDAGNRLHRLLQGAHVHV
jgi:hypothetical protein